MPRASAGVHSFVMLALALALNLSVGKAAESDEAVAVYSSVSPDYHRTIEANGRYRAETFAFGEGGNLGGTINDKSIDPLTFRDVAQRVAPALASKNYLPAGISEKSETKLLIMVYWGTTIGTDGNPSASPFQNPHTLVPPFRPNPLPGGGGMGGQGGRSAAAVEAAVIHAADNSIIEQHIIMAGIATRLRNRQDFENATILGYLPEIKRVESYKFTALDVLHQDIIDEVEESRYYVVLMAYDFQTLLKHKQRKLLWETRFSLPERGSEFDRQLAAMAHSAANYFGQSSHGIRRETLSATRVDLGELKVLETDAEFR